MATEQAPAYQWYVKDWRSSRKVQRMTFAERGMYHEMLDQQWEDGSLPSTPEELADLLGGSLAEWQQSLALLGKCFSVRSDGRLVNEKLEKIRKELHAFRKVKKLAGRHGGLAKAANRRKDSTLSGKQNVAQLDSCSSSDLAKRSSSSSTATATASATAEGTDARSNRPIFRGQRLAIFEWMLTDCVQTLGTHADDFDLHSWFFELDTMAAKSNLVIPKRDGGAWLQSQLMAEAKRRGLPIAVATTDAPVKRILNTSLEEDAAAVTAILRRQGAM